MFSELLDKSIFGFSVLVPRKLRQNPESSSPRPGPPRLGRPEVAGWCRPAISGSGGRVPAVPSLAAPPVGAGVVGGAGEEGEKGRGELQPAARCPAV